MADDVVFSNTAAVEFTNTTDVEWILDGVQFEAAITATLTVSAALSAGAIEELAASITATLGITDPLLCKTIPIAASIIAKINASAGLSAGAVEELAASITATLNSTDPILNKYVALLVSATATLNLTATASQIVGLLGSATGLMLPISGTSWSDEDGTWVDGEGAFVDSFESATLMSVIYGRRSYFIRIKEKHPYVKIVAAAPRISAGAKAPFIKARTVNL